MRTPQRYQNKPLPMMPEDNEVDDWVIEVRCARAKRKNRVKQLKRSLEKYKYGTHLSGSVGAAYRRLQGLNKLGKNATIQQWLHYMRELHRIQEHITCAISNAGIYIAAIAERKADRKGEK